MKTDHAWIDYELEGKVHRWKGDPDFYEGNAKLEDAMDAIMDEVCKGTFESDGLYLIPVVKRAGGRILEVHSVREDGSIQAQDLPDAYVN